MSRAVRAASVVTTLTGDQAARVRAAVPGIAAPVLVVPHGVDVSGERDRGVRSALGVATDAPFVVHVAGLRREKGFPETWDLVDRVREAVPDLRYALAGPVIDASLVPEADAWFRARSWAVRLGALERERTLDVVAAATCTLHASTVEGLSNALLESMALGVPPVARDIPASAAVIRDGIDGLLFRGSADAVRAVRGVTSDAALRDRLGRAACAAADRFSPGAEVAGYLGAYRIAIGH